jgi:MscS family membrane protein
MQDLIESIRSEWPALAGALDDPRLRAVLIVLGSVVVARLADWVLSAVLRRLVQRTRMLFDDQLVALLHGPVVKSVVLGGFVLATRQLGLDGAAVGEPRPIETFTVRVLMTLVLLVWAGFAFRFTRAVLRALSDDDTRAHVVQPRTYPLFDNLAKLLLFAVAVYLAIVVWDLDATGWLASAGVMGIALGFAAQDTLGNLFAGVFIIADGPFAVGDYIVLDSGERGRVDHIGLRSTRILTRDDIEITIPNSVIGKAKITNEAGGPSPKRRLRVPVGVAYGSDVEAVRAALMEVALAEPLICDDPEPRVRFRNLGESSLDFELLGWIERPELRGQAVDALLTAVVARFERDGITIPFPQRDLWVREMPGSGNPERS